VIQYLLDTDTFSYIARRRHPSVLTRFEHVRPGEWAISAITYAEVLFGLSFWPSSHPMRMRIQTLLLASEVHDWPSSAADAYATIKRSTRKQLLAEQDMLIAAHAIALEATLVTNNVRHFSRIGPPLRFENWVD
jgi:tRNA(fMet)-specific endonuclease VapC